MGRITDARAVQAATIVSTDPPSPSAVSHHPTRLFAQPIMQKRHDGDDVLAKRLGRCLSWATILWNDMGALSIIILTIDQDKTRCLD